MLLQVQVWQLARPDPSKPSDLELLHLLSEACRPEGPVALCWDATGKRLAASGACEANVW